LLYIIYLLNVLVGVKKFDSFCPFKHVDIDADVSTRGEEDIFENFVSARLFCRDVVIAMIIGSSKADVFTSPFWCKTRLIVSNMTAIFRDSFVVVRTRPRATSLAMITMRKSTHGFPLLYEYGAPLGGRQSCAFKYALRTYTTALKLALVLSHVGAWKKTCLAKIKQNFSKYVVMDPTEILHALETAVLDRNEDQIFPMIDKFRLTQTDLGERMYSYVKTIDEF